MAADRIRVGVIGASVHYGWGMRAHLPALLALPEYELVGLCTAHPETAEESARHCGARLAFHDYREMVRHPDIDMVSVCVRVPLHHSMVMVALEAGKHVYCEWPLGASLAEAEDMAALARSKDVRHMVGLQGRAAPGLLRFKELVAQGYVGDVLSCTLTSFFPGILQMGPDRFWMADRANGMNTLPVHTGHSLDVLSFCLGEFKEISARVETRVPVWGSGTGKTARATAPDNVLVSGVLTNGVVVSAHVGSVPWHGSGWKMEVYGTSGALAAEFFTTPFFVKVQLRGAHGKEDLEEELPVPERPEGLPAEVPGGIPLNVAKMYRNLGEAIREGRDAQPDFDAALARHRLLDAIQRSSDEATLVRVA